MAEYNGDYDIVAKARFSEYVNAGIYLDKRNKSSHTRDSRTDVLGQVSLLPGEVWETEVIAESIPDKFGVSIYSRIEGNAVVELVEDNKTISSVSTSLVDEWEDIEIVPNKKRFIIRIVNVWSYMRGDGVRRITMRNPYLKIGEMVYSPNEWLVSWELKEGSAGGGCGVWVKVNGEWVRARVY